MTEEKDGTNGVFSSLEVLRWGRLKSRIREEESRNECKSFAKKKVVQKGGVLSCVRETQKVREDAGADLKTKKVVGQRGVWSTLSWLTQSPGKKGESDCPTIV